MTIPAPTGPDQQLRTEPERDRPMGGHPLAQFVPDPSGLTPLCDEAGFATILEGMVADRAPRLFAVVQEYGERVDGQIAAWGMAFDDRAEVVSVGRGVRGNLGAPEEALAMFTVGGDLRARLVWVNPDAARPPEDDDETA